MGAVYLGRDVDLNRPVAIKVIREEIHELETLDRFFQEARAAAALRHPNIITIYASGQHEHQPYMVMEFVDGESLADIIRDGRDVPILTSCPTSSSSVQVSTSRIAPESSIATSSPPT